MTLNPEQQKTAEYLQNQVKAWLEIEGSAKSTLAGAIVVIDLMTTRGAFTEDDLFTPGGQVSGSRGRSLILTLEKYGLREMLDEYGGDQFLLDGTTTRSTRKFSRLAEIYLDWGEPLAGWTVLERIDAAPIILKPILEEMENYFKRQRIKLRPNLSDAPTAWIEQLLKVAHSRSHGRVEQHLVGAKLQKRTQSKIVSSHATFAADKQTERDGDFILGRAVFHVTAAPGAALVAKCQENIRKGLQPVLVVPRDAVERAKGLAAYEKIENRISFLAIEDFVAINIIEIASELDKPFDQILKEIIEIYNERIVDSESDLSLRIEVE